MSHYVLYLAVAFIFQATLTTLCEIQAAGFL